MAPFSDFDAALPYVAEMPKTLASSSSELAQRVDTPRGDRSERGKVGGPQPAPALVGGVVTVGRRQMCRGVVGGARARARVASPLCASCAAVRCAAAPFLAFGFGFTYP